MYSALWATQFLLQIFNSAFMGQKGSQVAMSMSVTQPCSKRALFTKADSEVACGPQSAKP